MNIVFRRAAPTALIISVIVVIVTLALLSNRPFHNLTNAVEQNQFDLMRTILRASLRAAEDRAMARAEMIGHLPHVRDLFAKQDREGLLAECGPMFEIQKSKYGVDQMQFHLPNAVSFLRLHAPTQHGDDLSKFRPMVVLFSGSTSSSAPAANTCRSNSVFPSSGRDRSWSWPQPSPCCS